MPDPVGTQAGEAGGSRSGRREQLWELLAFLFLVVPSMALSFFAVREGNLSFVLVATATIFRDLSFVALIGFFLWKNREGWGKAGLRITNGWTEILVGAALFVPMFFGSGLLVRLFQALGLSTPSGPRPKFLEAKGTGELILAGGLVIVVAICEEIIFRGYLILRLTEVTGSTAAAVLLSSVIFSLGHGYEGTAGVATVGILGLVFALVYLWRGNLVAPIMMHFLQDFISIVMVPLLRHR